MQLKDEVLKIHPEFEAFELVLKTKFAHWTTEDLWKDCANYKETILILKSNYNRLFGMYCPVTWKDYGGDHEIENGHTFMFFVEQHKLRVCHSKKQAKDVIYSDSDYPIG